MRSGVTSDIAMCPASAGCLRLDVRGEVQQDDRVVSFLNRGQVMDLIVDLKRWLVADASDLA